MARQRATGSDREGDGGSGAGVPATPPGPTRRAYAFEAGRRFHQARVAACDLAFAPQSPAVRGWFDAVTPQLLAAASSLAGPADPGVVRQLESWLHELRQWACGSDHAEELFGLQGDLDAMHPCESADFDLAACRAKVAGPFLEAFDRQRVEVCRALPAGIAAAFRLGEVVESGALVEASLRPPADPVEAEDPVGGLGFGAERGQGGDNRHRLVLAPPRPGRFELPWASSWPAVVRAEWAACGLPEPPDGTLPSENDHPPDPAGREQVIANLAAHASRHFGEPHAPALALRDRLRIIDVGAQQVSLDGTRVVIESPRAFAIFHALYQAPSGQLTTEEAKSLEGCGTTDISKELRSLPPPLKGIIPSSKGANAFYHFLLPQRPRAGG